MASNSLLWIIRVSKKTEKPIKLKKPEKNNWKNRTEKKLIKPINFFKKPAGSVRFRFYKQKTEKTEPKPSQTEKTKPNRKKPSQNRKKPSQNRENRAKTGKTEPNRFEPVFALKTPNRTETGRFDPVSVRVRFFFKKKISVWLLFFNKNRTEPKMITSNELWYYYGLKYFLKSILK